MSELAPETLEMWLEWAGARLIALPMPSVKPRDSGVIWPEYSQDKFQVLEFRKGMRIRAPIPSAQDITLMEEIIALPNLCTRIPHKRTVRLRTLIHPTTNRHIYSWRKIAVHLNTNRETAAGWYFSGLKEIAAKVPCNQVQRFTDIFEMEML